MQESAHELLRSVWEEASPDLSRLVCAMGITPGCAEDVLQDVYLTAWQKAPSVSSRVDLRRWLFRVAANRCQLEHRRQSRWQKVFHGLARLWGGRNQAGSAADAAAESEQRELVRRALARLEPRLRSILVMRYFAEFDSKEIGKILELSDSTVRSRLRTGRKQLALELRRSGYRDD